MSRWERGHLPDGGGIEAEGIPVDRQGRVHGFEARKEAAGEKTEHGDEEESAAGKPREGVGDGCGGIERIGTGGVAVVERAGNDGAGDDGDVRRHIDRAVGLGEVGVGDDFRYHAVLGGAEEGALDGQEEERADGQPEVADEKADESHGSDGDFDRLDVDRDALLARAVGDLSGEAGEDDEGHGEAEADVALTPFTELIGPEAAGGHAEGEDGLEDVVIGGAEKLGEEEGHESPVQEFAAGGRGWRHDFVSVEIWSENAMQLDANSF